ncbi:MAG: NADH-quinone oxidoreductase subunit M [Bacteroidetes bacterium]|nr:NADH-quinone oxidoreductase subunit M [Bacteroidota bacterium]MBU1422545.1 NADH-quinone oxidoreductase subunit M [Bacteroidota bacterium]MBU2472258.1 NADH-quinone oxidoreductase subunit M [Bacteroidota bacterium]
MEFLNIGVLTWITFLPIVGMVLVLLLPNKNSSTIKWTSAVFTGLQVIVAILIIYFFNRGMAGINTMDGFQFVEKINWIDVKSVPWVGRIDIDYFVGIDGISVPMVLLTAIISFIAVFASWNIDKAPKGYFALLLLLDTGMIGVFVSLDFFLFYVFWEIMLLPMYFLIGIWGGPRREYAAIKFFLYTIFGSVLMLLVMLALYFSVSYVDPMTGEKVHTFNMLMMMDSANYEPNSLLYGLHTMWRYIAYVGLFIGFAIKVPIFPFHTWLPDAHVEAPTAISVILAGVLLKMGTYGLLRISYPMFPDGMVYFAIPLAILGFVNIVYGALVAMAQTDFKKLIAYSSISHMGIVILGMAALNTQGVTGAVMQMFNHGTITAMLFLIVGVIYDRAHTRGLNDFGGLAHQMPKYTGVMTVAFFAALGLPGLSGFISEAFSLLGAFQVYRWITIASTLGIVLTAAYMLWTLQRLFLGKLPDKWKDLPDINGRELFTLVPLAIIVIFLGIYPGPMIDLMNSSVNHLVQFVSTNAGMAMPTP